MRTFTSLEIRFEYVLVGKLPNRRIIRRKIRSCDSGIKSFTTENRLTLCRKGKIGWINNIRDKTTLFNKTRLKFEIDYIHRIFAEH